MNESQKYYLVQTCFRKNTLRCPSQDILENSDKRHRGVSFFRDACQASGVKRLTVSWKGKIWVVKTLINSYFFNYGGLHMILVTETIHSKWTHFILYKSYHSKVDLKNYNK